MSNSNDEKTTPECCGKFLKETDDEDILFMKDSIIKELKSCGNMKNTMNHFNCMVDILSGNVEKCDDIFIKNTMDVYFIISKMLSCWEQFNDKGVKSIIMIKKKLQDFIKIHGPEKDKSRLHNHIGCACGLCSPYFDYGEITCKDDIHLPKKKINIEYEKKREKKMKSYNDYHRSKPHNLQQNVETMRKNFDNISNVLSTNLFNLREKIDNLDKTPFNETRSLPEKIECVSSELTTIICDQQEEIRNVIMSLDNIVKGYDDWVVDVIYKASPIEYNTCEIKSH